MSMSSATEMKCKKLNLKNNKLPKWELATPVTPAGRRPEFVSKSSQPPDIDELCSKATRKSINSLPTVQDHFSDVTTGGCSGKSTVSGFPASSAKAEFTSTRRGLPLHTTCARASTESVSQKPPRSVKKRKRWFELTEDEDEDPFHWSAPHEDPFHWENPTETTDDKPDVEQDEFGDIRSSSPPPPGNRDALIQLIHGVLLTYCVCRGS